MAQEVIIPSLIRDIYVPPKCPEPVSVLIEAACTLQNSGYFEASVNMFLNAQKKWEAIILQTSFPDLCQDSSLTTLQMLIADEQEREAQRDLILEQELELKLERLKVAAAAAPPVLAAAPGGGILPPPPPKGSTDKEILEQLRKSRESKAATKAQLAVEAQERQQKRIATIHICSERVPLEGKIYFQLSISSVFESSGVDELALAASLEALRLAMLLPAYQTSLVTACVYTSLASIYYHLTQLDFACDYLLKALEIREAVLPTGHVEIGQVAHNIGAVLLILSRPSDALAMLYRAMEIFTAQLPETHPRREACALNIQIAKSVVTGDRPPPKVPFNNGHVVIPVIPGARRAKEMVAGKKKKKASAKDDGKKGKK